MGGQQICLSKGFNLPRQPASSSPPTLRVQVVQHITKSWKPGAAGETLQPLYLSGDRNVRLLLSEIEVRSSFNAWNWLSGSYCHCSSLGPPTTKRSMSAIGEPSSWQWLIG